MDNQEKMRSFFMLMQNLNERFKQEKSDGKTYSIFFPAIQMNGKESKVIFPLFEVMADEITELRYLVEYNYVDDSFSKINEATQEMTSNVYNLNFNKKKFLEAFILAYDIVSMLKENAGLDIGTQNYVENINKMSEELERYNALLIEKSDEGIISLYKESPVVDEQDNELNIPQEAPEKVEPPKEDKKEEQEENTPEEPAPVEETPEEEVKEEVSAEELAPVEEIPEVEVKEEISVEKPAPVEETPEVEVKEEIPVEEPAPVEETPEVEVKEEIPVEEPAPVEETPEVEVKEEIPVEEPAPVEETPEVEVKEEVPIEESAPVEETPEVEVKEAVPVEEKEWDFSNIEENVEKGKKVITYSLNMWRKITNNTKEYYSFFPKFVLKNDKFVVLVPIFERYNWLTRLTNWLQYDPSTETITTYYEKVNNENVIFSETALINYDKPEYNEAFAMIDGLMKMSLRINLYGVSDVEYVELSKEFNDLNEKYEKLLTTYMDEKLAVFYNNKKASDLGLLNEVAVGADIFKDMDKGFVAPAIKEENEEVKEKVEVAVEEKQDGKTSLEESFKMYEVKNLEILLNLLLNETQDNLQCAIISKDEEVTSKFISKIVATLDEKDKIVRDGLKEIDLIDLTLKRKENDMEVFENLYLNESTVYVVKGIKAYLDEYEKGNIKEDQEKNVLDLIGKMNSNYYIILKGTKEEITALFEKYPKIEIIYNNCLLEFSDISVNDMFDIYSQNVKFELREYLTNNEEKIKKEFEDYVILNKGFTNLDNREFAIYLANYANSIMKIEFPKPLYDKEGLSIKLEKLAVLDDVKEKIRDLEKYVVFNIKARNSGIKLEKPNLNILFVGNEGTGKKNAAQMIADMLYELKCIPNNEIITIENKNIIEGFVLPKSCGIVYFKNAQDIDVAVMDKLLTEYDNENVLIFAGPKKEISEYIKASANIVQLLGVTVEFKDYSEKNIEEMLYNKIKNSNMEVDKKAKDGIMDLIKYHMSQKMLKNGKLVEKIFSELLYTHAKNETLPLDVIKSSDVPEVEKPKKD